MDLYFFVINVLVSNGMRWKIEEKSKNWTKWEERKKLRESARSGQKKIQKIERKVKNEQKINKNKKNSKKREEK